MTSTSSVHHYSQCRNSIVFDCKQNWGGGGVDFLIYLQRAEVSGDIVHFIFMPPSHCPSFRPALCPVHITYIL